MTWSNFKYSKSDVVLPRRCCCCCLKWTVSAVLCVAGVLLLWPWEPEVMMTRLMVRRVRVHPLPPVSADVYISMTVSVHNMDVYWMELTDIDVKVKYRKQKLGHVISKGWHVRAWGTSHVFGELESSVLPSSHVAHLLRDLAMGRVYFQTVAEVTGHLGLLFHHLSSSFKAILACDVYVNTKNHTIIRQHCVHEED